MVGVAQLVEHRVVVPVVAGSSPVAHPMSNEAERRSWAIKKFSLKENFLFASSPENFLF